MGIKYDRSKSTGPEIGEMAASSVPVSHEKINLQVPLILHYQKQNYMFIYASNPEQMKSCIQALKFHFK